MAFYTCANMSDNICGSMTRDIPKVYDIIKHMLCILDYKCLY
jgi:hypothetical protein